MVQAITVDVADLQVSADPDSELVTYSLGSCIGVAIWDRAVHVGGLLHFMLPKSDIAPDKASRNPATFADTGIPLLFERACELGAVKGRMTVKVAGGAKLFDTTDAMDIGKHNCAALREIFRRSGISIDGKHIGGYMSRTMRLAVGTGRVTVENRKMHRIEI